MLCPLCASIFSGYRHPTKGYNHHAYMHDLKQSATSGCHMCTNIDEDIKKFFDEPEENSDHIRYMYGYDHRPYVPDPEDSTTSMVAAFVANSIVALGDALVQAFRVVSDQFYSADDVPGEQINLTYQVLDCPSENEIAQQVQFFSQRASVKRRNGFRWSKSINLYHKSALMGEDLDEVTLRIGEFPSKPESSTKDSIEVAIGWPRRCLTNHEGCRVRNEDGWTPTRLINVQSSPPRLCERGEVPKGVAYTTLSHRWKSVPGMLLKTTNLEVFRQSIPPEALTPVFSDAVDFTRAAGIEYIWIDSLCIMQDSREDWAAESATMGKVYSHGLCNLAATADVNTDNGFYTSRKPLTFWPGSVQTEWQNLPNGHFVWLPAREIQVRTTPYSDENTELYSRGWVLQESCLSPRTVHFDALQIHWECREQCASETWPDGIPDLIKEDRYGSSFKRLTDEEMSEQELSERWIKLVERYTQCQLTQEGDRLVAISALAQHFAKHLKDEYVAGFWKRNIISGLHWSIHANDKRTALPSAYIAPSWSWASIGTNISFSTRSRLPTSVELAKVVEVSVTPRFSDLTYGALQDGHILLRGRLRSLRRGKPKEEETVWPPSYHMRDDVFHDPILHRDTLEPLGYTTAEVRERNAPLIYSEMSYSVVAAPHDDLVTCLPTILHWRSNIGSSIEGIMLEPVRGRPGMYTRSGRFAVHVTSAIVRESKKHWTWETEWDHLCSVVLGYRWSDIQSKVREGNIIDLDGSEEIRIL